MDNLFFIRDKDVDSDELKSFENSILNTNFRRLNLLALGIFAIECVLGFLTITGLLETTTSEKINIGTLFALAIFTLLSGVYLNHHDNKVYKIFVTHFLIVFVLVFVVIGTANRFEEGNVDISLFMTGVLAMSITVITKPLIALIRYVATLFLFILMVTVMNVSDIPYTIFINTGAYIAIVILCNSMIYRDQYRIFKEKLEKEKANASLLRLSNTDQLTGLNNRRRIDDVLGKAFENVTEHSLAVIILDIDYFKKINDKYGHLVGDKVLVEMTFRLQSMLREGDIVGRWGGEEFIVICKDKTIQDVVNIAERLRVAVLEETFAEGIKLTVSLGVSTLEEGESIKDLLSKADKALYKAKEEGRNRVEVGVE